MSRLEAEDANQLSDERYWDSARYECTLGSSDAVAEGKMRPPWAETSFSYRFTGVPPLEAYEGLL